MSSTGLVSSSGLEGVIKSLKMGKRDLDPVEQENSQSLEMHHLEKLLQMQISPSSGEYNSQWGQYGAWDFIVFHSAFGCCAVPGLSPMTTALRV